jgi:hypothetical protein
MAGMREWGGIRSPGAPDISEQWGFGGVLDLCQSLSMPNGRCRMHGGKSTGAPKGNQNALKHGRYTAQAIAERRTVNQLIRECRDALFPILRSNCN